MFRVGVGAVPLLLPLMLQVGFGLSPLDSGLLTFASAVGALFMKTMSTWILRRFGFRSTLVINAVVASLLMAACALFGPATPHVVIIAVLLAGGCMRSLQFTSLNAISYADVSQREPVETILRATASRAYTRLAHRGTAGRRPRRPGGDRINVVRNSPDNCPLGVIMRAN